MSPAEVKETGVGRDAEGRYPQSEIIEIHRIVIVPKTVLVIQQIVENAEFICSLLLSDGWGQDGPGLRVFGVECENLPGLHHGLDRAP